MLFRDLRSRWLTTMFPRRKVRPIRRTGLFLERLDDRVVPTITFDPISNFTFPGGKDLFVPLTAVDDTGATINYTVQSKNSSITAEIVTGGTTIKLTVTGKDKDNNTFTGDIVLRLFDDIAPLAAARIESLVQSHFYDGKLFHRVLNDFMAQAGSANGDGTGGSGQPTFDDEFNSSVTFVSPGLLAMANSGNDTNDAQFFIVDTDIALAQMPQHLNFKHTIVGQLVSGFDVFTKMMGTPVEGQSGAGSEVSKPVTPLTIVHAELDPNNSDGVLRIHAAADFTGSSQITVNASASTGEVEQTFTVDAVTDKINDRPFLGPVSNVSTSAGAPVTFDVSATDLENDQLTFAIRDGNDFATAAKNVTVTFDQGAHKATVTPVPGFVGTVDLLLGVRDQTDRSGVGLDDASNFNTEHFTLTVGPADIDLDASSDTGLYSDDNFTGDSTPSFTIKAPTGRTVTVSVNGTGSFAATESTTSPGTYNVTLPDGKLQVGTNTIGATVTGGNQADQTLTPLTIIYAPGNSAVYVVPGAPGTSQQLTLKLQSAESFFKNESGFYIVDSADGKIGTLSPDDPGYAKAALQRRQVLFSRGQPAGSTRTVTLQAGQMLGFYMTQNTTASQVLSLNSGNKGRKRAPVAFFSFTGANPDGIVHELANIDAANGRGVYAWEDTLNGGDLDYNDRVISVRLSSDTTPPAEAFRVPAGPGRTVNASFQLQSALKSLMFGSKASKSTAPGEIGFFIVDGPDGRIGSLHPGDNGYLTAALNAGTTLFNKDDPANTSKTQTLTGGVFFGFYLIQGGSRTQLLSLNPSNSHTGAVVAYFSFAAANPDNHDTHFRTFSPEGASIGATPTDTEPLKVHAMGKAFGSSRDFDDAFFTVNFTAITSAPPSISSLTLDPTSPGTDTKLTATAFASGSGGNLSLTYVWRVNGVIKRNATTTSLTDQFDLSVAGNGDRGDVVIVEVTPSNGTVAGASRTATTTIGNTVPVISQITFDPTTAGTNDTVTAHVAATDADGDAITFNYVWKVGGVVQQQTNNAGASDSFDLSAAGHGDRGQVVTVEVTPSDATGAGAKVTQQFTIANSLPTAQVTLQPDTNVFNDATLTANVTTSDGDTDSVTVGYVWKINGIAVQSTPPSSKLTDTLDVTATPAKPGDVITVEVTPNDGIDDGPKATAQVTLENRAPTTTGIADQSFNGPGEWNLVVAGNFSDPDHDQLAFSATLDDGSPLPAWLHVNSNGLLSGNPSINDAGTFAIKVTATDPSAAAVSTTFTLTVSNTPQSLNDLPTVDSLDLAPTTPTVADKVTATVTTSDGDGDLVTLNYVWSVNNNEVRNTTTSALTDELNLASVAGVQLGDVVKVEVTPFDGIDHGTLVSKTVIVG